MSKTFINRAIEAEFKKRVQANKVLVLYGARRVDKTELIRRYLSSPSLSTQF